MTARTKTIQIRITKAEKRQAERVAKNAKQTVSEYFYRLIEDELKQDDDSWLKD